MSLSRRGLLMLGTAALAVPAHAANLAFEAEALAWLRRAAHPFGDENPSAAELEPLVRALDGPQVIGVGEATHGTYEDFAFKAALIKALIARGEVRVLALECNYQPGLMFDRYVREGAADPMDLMRTSGFFQNWHSEEFGNLLTWIRAWNAGGGNPVRIIGVDCQASAADTQFALAWLSAHDPAGAEEMRPQLAPLLGPEARDMRLYEFIQTLDRERWQDLRKAVIVLGAKVGVADMRANGGTGLYSDARHAAVTALQGLWVYESDVPGAPPPQFEAEYSARRDNFMAENLIRLADGGRTALWAHNAHVLPLAAPDGLNGAMGHYLRRRLQANYRSVAFEYDRGLIHAKTMGPDDPPPARTAPWTVNAIPSRPDGLGALLAKSGMERFWIDVRRIPDTPGLAAWKAHPYRHDWPGFVLMIENGVTLSDDDVAALDLVDILVFFRTVTPSRLYRWVPRA